MYYLSKICFMCFKYIKNLHNLNLIRAEDSTVKQIKYILPEITWKPEIPAYICSTCHTELHSFYTFKKLCFKNYERLKHFTKLSQESSEAENHLLQIEINNIKIEQIDDDLTSEAHFINEEDHTNIKTDIEFVNCENIKTERNNFSYLISEEAKEVDQKETISNITDHERKNQDNLVYKNLLNKTDSSKDISIHTKDYNINNLITENLECINGNVSLSLNQNEKSDKNEIKCFQCKICNKMCARKFDLKVHIQIHASIKGFDCFICNKKITDRSNFEKHMKIHSGIKEFECLICNKKFLIKSTLKRHMKTHYGIKDFQCSICNSMFSQSNDLNLHLKLHTGIKDFECSICQKKFMRRHTMERHRKVHAGIKDFECTICNQKFSRKDHLRMHMKKHIT